MPDDIQNQTSESAAPEPFVTLGEGDAPLAFDDDGQPTDVSDAGDESPETAQADADEKPEMPSAESLGLDLSDPKQKAAYAELVKKHGQWTNRFLAKHKAKPETEATPAAQETPAAQATSGDDPYAEFFKLDADSIKVDPSNIAEDHPLHELRTELDDFIDRRVDQKLQKAMERMGVKDQAVRQSLAAQQQREQTLSKLAPYFDAVRDHPEFESKFAEIQEFARATEALAVKNPERWIRTVEAEFDLPRNWRGAADAEQRDTGRANQRIADKRLSTVPRPSRPAPTQGGGYASFDEEVAAKLRQMGR